MNRVIKTIFPPLAALLLLSCNVVEANNINQHVNNVYSKPIYNNEDVKTGFIHINTNEESETDEIDDIQIKNLETYDVEWDDSKYTSSAQGISNKLDTYNCQDTISLAQHYCEMQDRAGAGLLMCSDISKSPYFTGKYSTILSESKIAGKAYRSYSYQENLMANIKLQNNEKYKAVLKPTTPVNDFALYYGGISEKFAYLAYDGDTFLTDSKIFFSQHEYTIDTSNQKENSYIVDYVLKYKSQNNNNPYGDIIKNKAGNEGIFNENGLTWLQLKIIINFDKRVIDEKMQYSNKLDLNEGRKASNAILREYLKCLTTIKYSENANIANNIASKNLNQPIGLGL